MLTNSRSLLCAFSLAIVAAVVVTSAAAAGTHMPALSASCDEPGTPNQEQLRSDGHHQLIYSFENTARVTPHEKGDETGR
jgi:hypothetical protein